MSEEQEFSFYLTSRSIEERHRELAARISWGIFEKYDTAALRTLAAKLGGKKVYVVDDEPGEFGFIPKALTEKGAIVTIFTSAEDALEAAKGNLPDVVISDMDLGRGMTGWQMGTKWDDLNASM